MKTPYSKTASHCAEQHLASTRGGKTERIRIFAGEKRVIGVNEKLLDAIADFAAECDWKAGAEIGNGLCALTQRDEDSFVIIMPVKIGNEVLNFWKSIELN